MRALVFSREADAGSSTFSFGYLYTYPVIRPLIGIETAFM
jgi:hypothetical protein